MIDEQKQKILDFIRSQSLGVISTISSTGIPDTAVVGVSEKEDLSLIFGTFATYRKYHNIKKNSRVAFVIGWEDITVQYEGIAEELKPDEIEEAKQIHIAKSPHSEKFAELPEQRYFKVTPAWIRYTDFTNDKVYGEVFEVKF